MDRGIPLYAQDIAECMRRVGFEPIELRCPRWLARAPRPLRNTAFVLFEQIVAPVIRVARRCSVTVYPYNSAGLVDAAIGRSLIVVHDTLSNRRANEGWAARYIRATQWFHTALKRPVCAASDSTYGRLKRLKPFHGAPIRLWRNAFYSFEAALSRCPAAPKKKRRPLRILLCSGIGPNKDYAGAVKLFRQSKALGSAELRIVGFGRDARLARRRIERLPPAFRDRVVVLPRLTLDELVREYRESDLVWVHSKHEGFGRWIVEARLCERPVVASRIGAFLRFTPLGIHLYREHDFDRAVEMALADSSATIAPNLHELHNELEASVRELITSMTRRGSEAPASSRLTSSAKSEEPA